MFGERLTRYRAAPLDERGSPGEWYESLGVTRQEAAEVLARGLKKLDVYIAVWRHGEGYDTTYYHVTTYPRGAHTVYEAIEVRLRDVPVTTVAENETIAKTSRRWPRKP